MKKSTWGLLGLLIGQPVLVYLGQSALLPAIPSHYGWLGAVAYTIVIPTITLRCWRARLFR